MYKLIKTLIIFSLVIASQSLSAKTPTKTEQASLDNVFTMCRSLGPWPRKGDSDFCSCLKGNLGHFIANKEGFEIQQVEVHIKSLLEAKAAYEKKAKGESTIHDPASLEIPIKGFVTRDLFERVSFICESNPGYNSPADLIDKKKSTN